MLCEYFEVPKGGGVCMARVVRCDVLLALDLTSL